MAEREDSGARVYVFPGTGAGNVPLQVTRWTEKRASIAFTGSTARVVIPVNAEIVELAANENCYINFGDDTVVATSTITTDDSRLYLAGVQLVPVPIDPATDEPYTHIAAIQSVSAGILQIEQVA